MTQPKNLIDDLVLTEPAFAKKIGLSVATVRRQRWAGKLDYIELSDNRIGYRESYADRLIDERTVKATNTAA
jgi:hypothetical protein